MAGTDLGLQALLSCRVFGKMVALDRIPNFPAVETYGTVLVSASYCRRAFIEA